VLRRVHYDLLTDELVSTTPESSKGSPKVNFLIEAVVFKAQKRVLTRFECILTRFGVNSPPPTLQRGYLWHHRPSTSSDVM